MTFKTHLTALAGATALSVALIAPASAATTITGAISNISYHSTDPGLVIEASPIAFPTFSLANVGDSQSFDVMKIGTGEGSINLGEDTIKFPISVTFSFSNPTGTTGAPVTGSTSGFILPLTSCGILAGGCGYVDWGSPSVFNFGNGGLFSVELSNEVFGTPGSSTVSGKFTLLANSVPEPATWAMMIFGFGAIGAAMRRRQRTAVRYNFA